MTESARSSRTATLARIVGIAGPAVALLGIALVQMGAPPMVGFGMFALGILCGLIALITGSIGLYTTRGGVQGRAKALIGLCLGALMIVIVVVSRGPAAGLPPINDITTDLVDPPAFAPAEGDHRNVGRDMSYPPEFVDQVRAAYPDLAPIAVPRPPDEAYRLALAGAEKLGWSVTSQNPAGGTFEATETTAVFRFVDDISVRVRVAPGGGSTIDVRSKSRDGRGDMGANATRIRAFAAALRANG